MFCFEGLIGEEVDLLGDEIHRSFVFVTQVLMGDGDGESMKSVFLVPSVISQFSHLKGG